MLALVADPLLFTTWLAPGLPEPLFQVIAAHVSAGLGRSCELSVEPKISGPMRQEDNRFITGLTDVGFLCPPSFLWLTDGPAPSVTLVPLAPVYDDPRSEGRPVYFSDVVVRTESDIATFADLGGRRIGFNDHSSLSGYIGLLAELEAAGLDTTFFGEFVCVGSHRNALSMIAAGELDAAAIDSNVHLAWERESPARPGTTRSVASLGPHPAQPIVVRADAAEELVGPIVEQLRRPRVLASVRPYGIVGFAPISSADYESLRPACDLVARR